MQKNIVLLCLITILFLSCKKDKNIEVPAPIPLPLEKAIIGKWVEFNGMSDFNFINDSFLVYREFAFQTTFVCNAKYSINKYIYPQTLGFFQILDIANQCFIPQDKNLKMLTINDSIFTASRSYYTGNPPNYFIDVEKKYRKF